MRIALLQTDSLIGNLAGIAEAIRRGARAAADGGADLLLCPELAAIGYPPRDILRRSWLVRDQWQGVRRLAGELPLPTLLGCVEPLRADAPTELANALVLLADGAVQAVYRKQLLPTYDVFDERRYFRPGSQPVIVDIAGQRVGLTVCEDIWTEDFAAVSYEGDPVAQLQGRCDLVVNASASPYDHDKVATRRRMLASVAARLDAPLAYCNQIGGQDELLFDGDSCVIAADGSYHGVAPRWREDLLIADLASTVPDPDPVDRVVDHHRALVRGTADYCRKTRQEQVVIGLSGGIDSALVAALATEALGAAAVTGLLMPGPYSSPGSISDAEALADTLGIERHTLPIETLNRTALETLAPVFADLPRGVAEENLQSRLRGSLVMAAANKLGGMALTTGNKSEVAVGYCTIYGDMNGGLNPIGDLYKTEVYALARHLNAEVERIPTASIDKPPSAELAPDQRDSDSLPPYAVLDRILYAYIEGNASPQDLIDAGEDPTIVRRVVRLVEIAEFKRRQSAPILRVSRKAFGVGRRHPIARAIG